MKPPTLQMSAARTVLAVVDHGRSLDAALAAEAQPDDHASPQPNDHALVREICYGACRHYHYFDGILARLLSKPLRPHDRVVHFILVNGCYQIEHMRTPDHAAVSESVAAVAGTRFSWAGSLINGVLRNFLRRREQLKNALAPDAVRCAFPAWLYREIGVHWPEHAERIVAASNRKPPLTLRVNQRKIGRDAYLERLTQADIEASPTTDSELGVTLARPLPVERIPGFADGLASVQDESAQLALAASGLSAAANEGAGRRVLDGCAAPGGKACLLLEAQPQLAGLVAVDLPERVDAIARDLARLGLSAEAEVVAGDLTQPAAWWDGALFDHILLDVPCSGSGIIRRHPDIKHRRRAEDIAKFAQQQFNLLSKAWSLLASGGTLLYVTCSILPAENDAVIAQFITGRCDASPQALDSPPGLSGVVTEWGIQRLPGVHPGDGFYFCLLKRASKPQ